LHNWTKGAYLTHRFNPELGIGRVTAVEGRALVVEFPRSGSKLRLAANTDALVPIDLNPGRPVRITATRQETTVVGRRDDGSLVLANGEIAPAHSLWPLELEGALVERLALGELDEVKDFLTRLHVLHLLTLREADGLGSFLGDASACSRISSTSLNAPLPPTRCGGCSPTKSASARRSKPPSS
jgi:hypothetical protein